MLSVVTLAPNAQGILHHHPEEQWGVLLEGSAVRLQDGEEIPVKKGDFGAHRAMCPTRCVLVPKVPACSTCLALPGRSTERRGLALQARNEASGNVSDERVFFA